MCCIVYALTVAIALSLFGRFEISSHSTTPTRAPTPTSSRGSSRERLRVGQLATGITSIARVGRVGEDDREEIGVGVGVVECELNVMYVRFRRCRHSFPKWALWGVIYVFLSGKRVGAKYGICDGGGVVVERRRESWRCQARSWLVTSRTTAWRSRLTWTLRRSAPSLHAVLTSQRPASPPSVCTGNDSGV